MKTETYQGVVQGQTVIFPEGPLPLADGTRVLVTPLPPEPGTAAALVAAMEAEPHLTEEDVAELERAIALGNRPPAQIDLFLEEPGGSGTVP